MKIRKVDGKLSINDTRYAEKKFVTLLRMYFKALLIKVKQFT